VEHYALYGCCLQILLLQNWPLENVVLW
jgi:hypothetical protein